LRGGSLDEFSEDYADRASQEVLSVIALFCTPLGDEKDEALYQHILQHTRAIVADGALQKVAATLRATAMPRVVLIQRDPAHLIRIATKEPLTRTFDEQHARLFTGPGALFKKVQFSDAIQARLEAAQRLVVQERGAQGGSVTHIMRHFSFAPHRFESWTGPRRRFACCLHAIALLLADLASDSRRKAEERRQAEDMLEWMTPRNLMEVGISADYGELCQRPPGGGS
jgi:hypothetical protein